MSAFDYNADSQSIATTRSRPSESECKSAYFTLGKFSPMSTSTCSEDVRCVRC